MCSFVLLFLSTLFCSSAIIFIIKTFFWKNQERESKTEIKKQGKFDLEIKKLFSNCEDS